MDVLRQIATKFEAIVIAQRRGRPIKYVSEDEAEEIVQFLDLEEGDEGFLRTLTRVNVKPHFNPPNYHGNFDIDELLDWIFEIDKHFEYENTSIDKKFLIEATNLKGHASPWWSIYKLIDREMWNKLSRIRIIWLVIKR